MSGWSPCAPVLRLIMENRNCYCWNHGVQLKSNNPFNCVYAYRLGSSLEVHSRLRIISACSNTWYQFWMGKSVSVDHRTVMKLYLKVTVAHYAALCWLIPVGTRWQSICFPFRRICKVDGASLSILVWYGLISLVVRCSWSYWKTQRKYFSFLAFVGHTRVLLMYYL